MTKTAIKEQLDVLIPHIRGHVQRQKDRVSLAYHAAVAALAVLGGIVFSLTVNAVRDMDRFVAKEIGGAACSVFLNSEADRPFVEERLLAGPEARSVRFVSREEALGRAHEDPALAESLKWTVRNPLPESFDVDWNPKALLNGSASAAAKSWSDIPGVSSVGFDAARWDRVAMAAKTSAQIDMSMALLCTGAWSVVVLSCFFFVLKKEALSFGKQAALLLVVGVVGGGIGSVLAALWVGFGTGAGLAAGALVGSLGGLARSRWPG